jgi:hypothetical protein
MEFHLSIHPCRMLQSKDLPVAGVSTGGVFWALKLFGWQTFGASGHDFFLLVFYLAHGSVSPVLASPIVKIPGGKSQENNQ